MRGGDFLRAQSLLETSLAGTPHWTEALYCLAVCQRKLGRHGDALTSLKQLVGYDPDNARAYQERGYVLDELREATAAIEAFEHATRLNPALFASWRALARFSDYPHAAAAAREAQRLEGLPRELVAVASWLYQGQLPKAEELCRQFLKRQPRHPEAMRLLAAIASQLQVYDDAEVLLENAVALHPNYLRAKLDYVEVLHRRQKFSAALAQAQSLTQAEPDNPAFLLILGHAQQGAGEFAAAQVSYQRAKALAPQLTSATVALGNAQKTIGQTAQAIAAYEEAIRSQPDYGEAYWSLSNLKTYRFKQTQIEAMQRLLEKPLLSEVNQTYLCFALGKAFEDQQDYDSSFRYYHRGNELRSAQLRYDRSQLESALSHQRTCFDRQFFAERQQGGCPAPDPIFVVGLPRAGSTLLEQILSAHSDVDATMELSSVLSIAHGFGAQRAGKPTRRYPDVLAELSAAERTQLGEQYLRDAAEHRGGAPFFVDKMPNNFRHIALLKLILPNAKIIDARRNPMACCFSGYKQLFAEGQEFSYRLEDLAHYYQQYVEIMRHWEQALPGTVLRVDNEALIEDPEGQIRRMLDFCGLKFEVGCLNFHENSRAVRTPSSEQVRQPIYRSAVHQWQHYSEHLKPLSEALL